MKTSQKRGTKTIQGGVRTTKDRALYVKLVGCETKVAYGTEEQARVAMPSTQQPYDCEVCGKWHRATKDGVGALKTVRRKKSQKKHAKDAPEYLLRAAWEQAYSTAKNFYDLELTRDMERAIRTLIRTNSPEATPAAAHSLTRTWFDVNYDGRVYLVLYNKRLHVIEQFGAIWGQAVVNEPEPIQSRAEKPQKIPNAVGDKAFKHEVSRIMSTCPEHRQAKRIMSLVRQSLAEWYCERVGIETRENRFAHLEGKGMVSFAVFYSQQEMVIWEEVYRFFEVEDLPTTMGKWLQSWHNYVATDAGIFRNDGQFLTATHAELYHNWKQAWNEKRTNAEQLADGT